MGERETEAKNEAGKEKVEMNKIGRLDAEGDRKENKVWGFLLKQKIAGEFYNYKKIVKNSCLLRSVMKYNKR